MENLQKILSEIIGDFIPDFKSIEDISRLSGGSSNESWKITLNTRENKKKIVFRRTPGGNLKDEESNNFVDITDEAKVMNIANAPGIECHAGDLGTCLKYISGGLVVDYVGATGVELDAGGTANGSYAEREVIGGVFTDVKIHK